jgi:hypothetical protein
MGGKRGLFAMMHSTFRWFMWSPRGSDVTQTPLLLLLLLLLLQALWAAPGRWPPTSSREQAAASTRPSSERSINFCCV